MIKSKVLEDDGWSDNLEKAPDGKRIWAGNVNEKYKVKYTHDGSTYSWWEVWDIEKGNKVCNLQTKEAADFVVELIKKSNTTQKREKTT